MSDIQDYFEYIIKKHERVTDIPPIRIYANKIENDFTFRIKATCYFELLTPETIKLLGNNKSKKTKDKNPAKVPHMITFEKLQQVKEMITQLAVYWIIFISKSIIN